MWSSGSRKTYVFIWFTRFCLSFFHIFLVSLAFLMFWEAKNIINGSLMWQNEEIWKSNHMFDSSSNFIMQYLTLSDKILSSLAANRNRKFSLFYYSKLLFCVAETSIYRKTDDARGKRKKLRMNLIYSNWTLTNVYLCVNLGVCAVKNLLGE